VDTQCTACQRKYSNIKLIWRCPVCASEQVESAPFASHNSAMDEICAHYVQFEDCVFFPGDVSCGEKACAVKPRRLRQ